MPFIIAVALATAAVLDSSASQVIPVNVGGRALRQSDGGLRFGWPGVYFEGRFRGTAVTSVVDASGENMRLLVDGEERFRLHGPGRSTIRIDGLADTEHVVRLEKQSESQSGGGTFGGFFTAAGSTALPAPARARQIEFVGDSYTVGYGNTSASRTCTPEEIHDRTDTQQAFGPLLARQLDADYRINAYSGFGIVRNYNGGSAGLNLPTIYPRLVPGDATAIEGGEAGWHPQLIVINLGTNDFSTELNAGEAWPNAAALHEAYRTSYVAFARGLMRRHPGAKIILMGSEAFYPDIQQVAAKLNGRGKERVTTVKFGDLELTGCDWHPSLNDNRAMARLLEDAVARLEPFGGASGPPQLQ